MAYATYADRFRPSGSRYTWLYDVALIVGFSLLIGLCAQITIPLPFTPVPITGQTFAVLLTGALLGSKRGTLSLLTYMTEGLTGLPVFAGGKFGLAVLFGPSGGYLVGYVVAAYLIGLLAEKGWDRRIKTSVLAMLVGNVAIYACGLPWLAVFVGIEKALPMGLLPFIPGDLIKIGLAASLLPIGWTLIDRGSSRDSE